MRRFLIRFLVLGLMAGSVATAEAGESNGGERTVEHSYTGSFVYFFSWCAPSGGMGCVSIPSRETETFLAAKVTDAHGLPVSVKVMANTQNDVLGDEITFGAFCGDTTERILFHPGVELQFYIGVPSADCLPGTATTGTIRVTLSSSPGGADASGPASEAVRVPRACRSSMALGGPKGGAHGKTARLMAKVRPCPDKQG